MAERQFNPEKHPYQMLKELNIYSSDDIYYKTKSVPIWVYPEVHKGNSWNIRFCALNIETICIVFGVERRYPRLYTIKFISPFS